MNSKKEPLWTAIDVAQATGGTLVNGGDWLANGVSIDSRALAQGDLFVALHAARDGHDFVKGAFKNGAAAALVDRAVEGGPYVLVDDTLAALSRLAVAARARSAAYRVAVTGSVGKSSVKEALAAIFRAAGPAHVSEKSYNNQWGVPLSLARMPQHTKRAAFELGTNHPGEIGPLAALVRPHVGVVTTIAPAHMAAFDGLPGIAAEKAQIWAHMMPSGVALVPADDGLSDLLAVQAKDNGAGRVVRFGFAADADVRVLNFTTGPKGGAGVLDVFDETVDFSLPMVGEHWAGNAAAAVGAAMFCGVEAGIAAAALAAIKPLPGRGGAVTLTLQNGDKATLLDDAYNANPVSMAAALKTLGAWPGKRRLAVLGDMLELGPEAPRYHEALAWNIEQNSVDLVFCAGPLMQNLFEALPAHRRGGWYENADALARALPSRLEGDDVILVKGSHGSHLYEVVNDLRKTLKES